MSRLQKKKSEDEKKKKRTVTERDTNESGTGTGLAKTKSTAAIGPSKAKQEKNLPPDGKSGEPNLFQQSLDFFREVKVELKKVTWPTRKQTTGTTIVVIIFVFVVSAFLGLFDLGLSKLVQVVLT